MAFISSLPAQHIVIPHEPGEWIEIKPVSVGSWREIGKAATDKTVLELQVLLLLHSLTAWSYERAIDEEAINDLDRQTFDWINNEVNLLTVLRPDAEKKGSSANSSLISGQAVAPSPQSSSI